MVFSDEMQALWMPKENPSKKRPSLSRHSKVLVVEDESSVRVLLGRILERGGYVVSLAEGAAEAREMMVRERFDVLLCDIVMPGESGMDLARWAIRTYPDMAVVMVSVVSDLQVAASAMEMGVYG